MVLPIEPSCWTLEPLAQTSPPLQPSYERPVSYNLHRGHLQDQQHRLPKYLQRVHVSIYRK